MPAHRRGFAHLGKRREGLALEEGLPVEEIGARPEVEHRRMGRPARRIALFLCGFRDVCERHRGSSDAVFS
jgi:hypothetical protein